MGTTQVQPDEEQLRRNLAITLGTQPPMIPQQPQGPQMASPGNIMLPGEKPVDLSVKQPTVFGPYGQTATGQNASPMAPKGTLEGDKQDRQREIGSGSGISQIAKRIENSGFGQAHPTLGKIAGVGAQGLATLGDIGIGTLGGGMGRLALSELPGTFEHHNVQVAGENRQIGAEETEQQKQATTEAEKGRTALEAAQTAALPGEAAAKEKLTDAQVVNLLHPQAKTDFEAWRQQNPDAPVTDWLKAQQEVKPQKEETPQAQTFDSLIASGMTPEQAYEKIREKPAVIGGTATQNEADKMGARLAKPYETAATQAQAKMDRIDQTLRSVDAGYVGQGLAIPELLTSLVSGQGTGVRITQPELNAITRHRGIQGDAESWFNSLAGKGNLTGNDKAQIRNVLNDAKGRMIEKTQLMNDAQDAINSATSRQDVVEADKKYRAIQTAMEKYMEVRRDDQGNYFGSNDGGKTAFDLASGKEAK